MADLIEVTLDPQAVETLVEDAIVTAPENPVEQDLRENDKNIDLDAHVTIDMTQARAAYRFGALELGPVLLSTYIRHLILKIDWHRALNIPRHACVKIVEACGRKLEVCWDWDWGVTHLTLLQNVPLPPIAVYLPVLDVEFRPGEKNGVAGYKLFGKFSLVAIVVQALSTGFVEGVSRRAQQAVRAFLEQVLGSGDLAKVFIALIMGAWDLVNVVLGWFSKLLLVLLQPIDELLHELFGEALELELGYFLPRNYELMPPDGKHAQVLFEILRAPLIDLTVSGGRLKLVE